MFQRYRCLRRRCLFELTRAHRRLPRGQPRSCGARPHAGSRFVSAVTNPNAASAGNARRLELASSPSRASRLISIGTSRKYWYQPARPGRSANSKATPLAVRRRRRRALAAPETCEWHWLVYWSSSQPSEKVCRSDFRQKPESYRPATDELKRFLPHVSGFLFPFDHRIELSKAAQPNAVFNRL